VAASGGLLAALAAVMVAVTIVLAAANRVTVEQAIEQFVITNHAVGVSMSVVGTLIAMRRPDVRLGWYMAATAVVCLVPPLAAQYARFALVTMDGQPAGGLLSAWVATFSWPIGYALVLVGLPLLFPDDRARSRARPYVVACAGIATVLMVAGSALSPGTSGNLPDIPNPFPLPAPWLSTLLPIGTVLLLASLLAAVILLLLRYRKGNERARIQIRAFLVVAALLLVAEFVVPVVVLLVTGDVPDALSSVMEALLGPALAVTIGFSVLRHHLHDIDVVVNRTVVYAVMSILVTAAYVLLVWYLATALGINGTVPGLIVTIVVAIGFYPAMQAVQQIVNRAFYGQRDDPYRLLTVLGERLQSARSSDAVLTAVATTIRQGLRVPFAEVSIRSDDGSVMVASSGNEAPHAMTVPLVFGMIQVGELSVSARQPGAEFGNADRRVILDFASHVGSAAYAVRLAGELSGARARLLSAREAERSRLRRDLHDGLGPDLGAQAVALDAVRSMLRADPDRAERVLIQLRENVQREVRELRRIVNDLHPAALADNDLAFVITELVEGYRSDSMETCVSAQVPSSLPAAVEVAAMRIVAEAVANAARHSGASLCSVVLTLQNECLIISIEDDGCGLPRQPRLGVGLESMRERAAGLGGSVTIGDAGAAHVANNTSITGSVGTIITARIPIDGRAAA
jgi:signal transduction histidine kinase